MKCRQGGNRTFRVGWAGRTVRALCDGTLSAGEHDVRWDGRNAGGSRVGSGIYFYRFVVNGRTLDGRLTLVR